ncbi:MAG TPA: membrane dipeptidase [Verrucomicrobiae bacterium]|jgi:microsomal dipeptidase-like Zn-dependent dipeptidase|nr:membrane dipeptidase [Verrucomicrobiae bacterium]
MAPSRRSVVVAGLAAAGLTIGGPVLRRAAGTRLSARTERRLNRVADPGPYLVSPAAADLHERLTIVDLHADSLLWGRDLLIRASRGHIDIPRMVEGNLALQVFSASTHVPRHLNYERNDDSTDDIRLVAIVQGWPRPTWTSRLARAEYLAGCLRDAAARSEGGLRVVTSAADLAAFLERRTADPGVVAGLLSIEGAHALDDDLANLERIAAAGYRMVGLAHFFDNAFAGSAQGVAKIGLTGAGRELVAELERRRILVDVAHSSAATIDDVLAIATRPVVASHGGVRAVADNDRNLSDEHLRGIAATGGLVGIGFWPTASGGNDPASIARSIAHAVAVVGAEHVGLGSDFDGAVPTPFDVTGLPLLTEALLAHGLDEAAIGRIMGGNAVELLARSLPAS